MVHTEERAMDIGSLLPAIVRSCLIQYNIFWGRSYEGKVAPSPIGVVLRSCLIRYDIHLGKERPLWSRKERWR